MTTVENLREVLLEELKDVYSAELQLVKALPEMQKKAKNARLRSALKSHLDETRGQVDRLEQAATLLGEKLTGKTCEAMKGLIEEAKEVLKVKSQNDAVIDALIIGAAQRVEHYEIAAYGTARAMAEQLGEDEIVKLLSDTLSEESAADETLSAISVDEVLPEAAGDESSSDEPEEAEEGEDEEYQTR